MVWLRTDGVRVSQHPELAAQFDVDKTVCQAEIQRAELAGLTVGGGGISGAIYQAQRNAAGGDVGRGCMAERGYVQVPEEQADEEAAKFARAAAAGKIAPPAARHPAAPAK